MNRSEFQLVASAKCFGIRFIQEIIVGKDIVLAFRERTVQMHERKNQIEQQIARKHAVRGPFQLFAQLQIDRHIVG